MTKDHRRFMMMGVLGSRPWVAHEDDLFLGRVSTICMFEGARGLG